MPFDPANAAKHLRRMHRAGDLSHAAYIVSETLLWSCRRPGSDEAQISYKRLAKLAHVAYSTAVEAIKALIRCKALSKRNTRLRVSWSLGIASRQWRNVYRFILPAPVPNTESDQRATLSVQVKKLGSDALERALSRLGSALGRS